MPDTIDQAAGLSAEASLYALRRHRAKVVDATQRSHDLFFAPDAQGLTLPERCLVAAYACHLSGATELARHYDQLGADSGVSDDLARAAVSDAPDAVGEPRLRQILRFTRALIINPVEGEQAQIEALRQAGIADADIVTLAQLIGFVSYQLRVVAGLQAMQEAAS